MTAGFSVSQAATCRGVTPPSARALGSAPDWMQSVTSAAAAASKYSFEFQSAQSMAVIGVVTTVKERLITATICIENLGCIVTAPSGALIR